MAQNPFPGIVSGSTLGSDAASWINNSSGDSSLSIRRISAIANVSEIIYFKTGTIIYAENEKCFYQYNGSAWVAFTDIPSISGSVAYATNSGSSVYSTTATNATVHIAKSGSEVHNLGTISVQSASAVFLSGSTTNVILESKQSGAGSAARFGDGVGNYSVFEADGTLYFSGSATVYDDLFVPLTTARIGANNKPAFDETNVGYLFPQNDPTAIMYMIAQMPHSYKEGSDVDPHVHWRQTTAGSVAFYMDYKWFNIGDPVSGSWQTVPLGQLTQNYVSGSLHQLSQGAIDIHGAGKKISSIMLIKLYRNDNDVVGNVLAYQWDLHFEKDTVGSRKMLSKS